MIKIFFLVCLVIGSFCFKIQGMKLIQYDENSQQYGSRLTILNSQIITSLSNSTSYFNRYVLLLKKENYEMIQQVLDRNDIIGVIFLLDDQENLKELENFFYKKTINKSVYFCKEQDLKDIFEKIKNDNLIEYFHILSVEKDSTVITPLHLFNYQGNLISNQENGPIILITTSFDRIHFIPELKENGTNVVGFLEIQRLFYLLYQNTKSNYQIIFLLTQGKDLNYEGTKHWMKRLKGEVEFVLCLDDLDGKDVNLYLSEKTNEKVMNFLKLLQSKSKEMNIPFKLVMKKIDTGIQKIIYPHEIFAYKKVESFTLISKNNRNLKNFERNIKLIIEALGNYIYNKNIEIFKGSLEINNLFVQSWLNTFLKYSRYTPSISKDLATSIKKTMELHSNQFSEQEFESKSPLKFYNNQNITIQVYKVKSFIFDMILLIPILLYSYLLFYFLK